MQQLGVVTENTHESRDRIEADGATVVYAAIDNRLAGLLGIADQVRPEAKEIIARLQGMGLEVILLTGDATRSAQAVARKVGIKHVEAEVLPEQKAEVIRAVQSQGRVTGMVGDGINDAPALALADVGIAMGGGMDVAMESGDVVLMRSDLRGVITALGLSRAVMRNIRQNLFWAFAFNTIGIPVAAGLLHVWGGPLMSPMLAGSAMAMSSVMVVGNALRLRFFTSAPTE